MSLNQGDSDTDKESIELLSQALERTVYRTVEHGKLDIPLSEMIVNNRLDLYTEIKNQAYIKAHIKAGDFVLQAGGVVELIPLNERVAIEVAPRASIKNLARILFESNGIPATLNFFSREYDITSTEIPSLLDTFAQALIDAMESLLVQGLHKSYVQKKSTSSFPKGRILLNETVQRFEVRGIRYCVSSSRFTQVVDNDLNQCLKYAVWYIARRYKSFRSSAGKPAIISKLSRIYRMLDSIKLDYNRDFLRDPMIQDMSQIPSIRNYYIPALTLAQIIILGKGIRVDTTGGDVSLSSLVWNLENSFESYLRVILIKLLKSSSISVLDGSLKGQEGAGFLFDQGHVEHLGVKTKTTPDIVLKLNSKLHPQKNLLIIEVKYKDIKDIRDEINQAITYAVAYRCPNVVLAHPKIGDQKPGLFQQGKIDNLNLYSYIFDLAADDLESEETVFVQEMKKLAEQTIQLSDKLLIATDKA